MKFVAVLMFVALLVSFVAGDCKAIATAAKKAVGKKAPYVWGGGNYDGPSTGIDYSGCSFSTMVGFDCSGLALYAVYQGTGKQLSHNAQAQYDSTDLGKRVKTSKLQAGDLVFYGSSASSIYHVAVYLGNDTIAEATDFDSATCVGQPSHTTALRTNNLISHGMRFC